MDGFCYQAAIRSHHETSKFCIDRNVVHSSRNKNFLIYLADTFTDHSDIIRSLIWSVRDSDSTGKIDELDVCSCLFVKFYCQFEHYFCKHRIILICYGIAGKECMDTEILGSFGFEDTESIKDLLCCHSVFCISRVVHDIIADLEHTARIVTATDRLRYLAYSTLYCFDMCDIIQVDDSADLICITEFCFRSIVGREHDITFFASDRLGKHQLCHGRAVAATAVLLKDLDQIRVRSCLYSKKFFEAFVPCECFF